MIVTDYFRLILSSHYCFQISTYSIKMLSYMLPLILLLSLFCVHSSDAKCCPLYAGYPIDRCRDGSTQGWGVNIALVWGIQGKQ